MPVIDSSLCYFAFETSTIFTSSPSVWYALIGRPSVNSVVSFTCANTPRLFESDLVPLLAHPSIIVSLCNAFSVKWGQQLNVCLVLSIDLQDQFLLSLVFKNDSTRCHKSLFRTVNAIFSIARYELPAHQQ